MTELVDYTLVIEMFNHKWHTIEMHLPLFKSLKECQWWSEYLSYIFREHHNAVIYTNKCVAV